MIDLTVTAPAGELSGNADWVHSRPSYSCSAATQTPGSPAAHPRPTHARPMVRDRHPAPRAWYGRSTLRALVSATVYGEPHRVIGVSDPSTLSFDDLPPSPVHGSIAVQWVDFGQDDTHGLKAYDDDAYHLRLDPDSPVLYLNSGFDGLVPLLEDRKRRPRAEQAMHDSTRTKIAGDSWQAMFVASLNAVETDPETGIPSGRTRSGGPSCSRPCSRASTPTSVLTTHSSKPSQRARATARASCWSDLPAAAKQVGASMLLRRGITLLEKDGSRDTDDHVKERGCDGHREAAAGRQVRCRNRRNGPDHSGLSPR